MLFQSQLRICATGVCAIIVSFVVLWLFRPETQTNYERHFDALLPMSILFAAGIVTILYGLQRTTSRRIARLARAFGIYLFLGVAFWVTAIGALFIYSGFREPLLPSIPAWYFAMCAWMLLLWPHFFILVLQIFGYGFS